MKYLTNMEHICNLVVGKNDKPIVKLYKSAGVFYILDVVLMSNFMHYYAYEVSEDNLRKFLLNKKNEYLLPNKGQIIYTVHFFDFKILATKKYKKSDTIILSFNDELYECNDEDKVQNFLNIQTKSVKR